MTDYYVDASALVAADAMQTQDLPPPIFVAADGDLLTAAVAEHLPVENPLSYPESTLLPDR